VGRARFRRADVAVFHAFRPPPFGGGNQFLRALVGELERRGLRVALNAIPPSTRACLFNSYNFDAERLRAFPRRDCRLVHRVDGPLSAYRGFDDGTDALITELNRELADATVLQSCWSFDRHRQLGIGLRDPHVVRNTVDPRIFNATGRATWHGARPLRLISVSWSDNENKGGQTYAWLDGILDRSRFEYTFVGRTRHPLPHGRMLPPQPSEELAGLLREHDAFVTASLNDPCSNALLEALACGLPAVFVRSGGHPELVGEAGFGFECRDEIPALLDRLVDEYEARRAAISVPSLAQVADGYLQVLGVEARDRR
jgi:Glycosyl transferases group 1